MKPNSPLIESQPTDAQMPRIDLCCIRSRDQTLSIVDSNIKTCLLARTLLQCCCKFG